MPDPAAPVIQNIKDANPVSAMRDAASSAIEKLPSPAALVEKATGGFNAAFKPSAQAGADFTSQRQREADIALAQAVSKAHPELMPKEEPTPTPGAETEGETPKTGAPPSEADSESALGEAALNATGPIGTMVKTLRMLDRPGSRFLAPGLEYMGVSPQGAETAGKVADYAAGLPGTAVSSGARALGTSEKTAELAGAGANLALLGAGAVHGLAGMEGAGETAAGAIESAGAAEPAPRSVTPEPVYTTGTEAPGKPVNEEPAAAGEGEPTPAHAAPTSAAPATEEEPESESAAWQQQARDVVRELPHGQPGISEEPGLHGGHDLIYRNEQGKPLAVLGLDKGEGETGVTTAHADPDTGIAGQRAMGRLIQHVEKNYPNPTAWGPFSDQSKALLAGIEERTGKNVTAGAAEEGEVPATEAEAGKPPPGGEPPNAHNTPHSDEAIAQAALANPMTREELMNIRVEGEGEHAMTRSAMDPVRMEALKNYAETTSTQALQMAQQAMETGDPELAAQAAELTEHVINHVSPRLDAANHYGGLLLRHSGDPALRQTLQALKDRRSSVMGNFVDAVASLPDAAARREMMKQAAAGGLQNLGDNMMNYYVESKLSFNTVGKKMSTDGLKLLYTIPERLGAEVAGGVRRGLGANPEATTPVGTTLASLNGLGGMISDASKLAYQSLKRDTPMMPGSVGYGEASSRLISSKGTMFDGIPGISHAIDLLGQFIHLPSRGILGVDQFAKSMNFQMGLRAELFMQAAHETAGLSAEDFAARHADLIAHPPPGALARAQNTMITNTYGAPMNSGGHMGAFLQWAQKGQQTMIGRAIMPFFGTLVNLARETMELGGPLAALSKSWRDRLASGTSDSDLALAKLGIGSLMSYKILEHVANGSITGAGPQNPEIKKLWEAEGNQPYSIKIGKHVIGNLPAPYGELLGILADGHDIASRSPGPIAERVAGAIIPTIGRYFEHETFLQNFMSLTHLIDVGQQQARKAMTKNAQLAASTPESQEAIEAETGEGPDETVTSANKEVQKLLGSVIPSNIANFAHGLDPVNRQVRGILDEMASKTPGWSKTLPPQRDLFGRPVLTPLGWSAKIDNLISLFRVTKLNPDPVTDELVKVNPSVPAIGNDDTLIVGPHGAMEKIGATPQQIDEVARLRGEYKDDSQGPNHGNNLHDALASVIKDPQYQQLSQPDRKTVLQKIIVAYTRAAHGLVFQNDKAMQKSWRDARGLRANVRAQPMQQAMGAQ